MLTSTARDSNMHIFEQEGTWQYPRNLTIRAIANIEIQRENEKKKTSQIYVPLFFMLPLESSFTEKSKALAVLRSGRSSGKPSLKCRDFLTSTAKKVKTKNNISYIINQTAIKVLKDQNLCESASSKAQQNAKLISKAFL